MSLLGVYFKKDPDEDLERDAIPREIGNGEREKGRGRRGMHAFLDCLYGEGVCCWASRDCMSGAAYVSEHRIDGS